MRCDGVVGNGHDRFAWKGLISQQSCEQKPGGGTEHMQGTVRARWVDEGGWGRQVQETKARYAVAGREKGAQSRFHQNIFTSTNLCISLGPRASSGFSSVSLPTPLGGSALPVDGKEQSQSCHCFLPPWQVVHRPETFARSHTIVVDAIQVGLLRVLRAQECLGEMQMGEELGLDLEGDEDRKTKRKSNRMVGTGWVRGSSLPGHCCCGTGPCRSHQCWSPQIQNKHWSGQSVPSWSVQMPAWPSWLAFGQPQTLPQGKDMWPLSAQALPWLKTGPWQEWHADDNPQGRDIPKGKECLGRALGKQSYNHLYPVGRPCSAKEKIWAWSHINMDASLGSISNQLCDLE